MLTEVTMFNELITECRHVVEREEEPRDKKSTDREERERHDAQYKALRAAQKKKRVALRVKFNKGNERRAAVQQKRTDTLRDNPNIKKTMPAPRRPAPAPMVSKPMGMTKEAVDREKYAKSLDNLADKKLRDAAWTRKYAGQQTPLPLRQGDKPEPSRKQRSMERQADQTHNYAITLQRAHSKYLRRKGIGTTAQVRASRAKAREMERKLHPEDLQLIVAKVLRERQRRYVKPQWRQKGLSTATNITQGQQVGQSSGAAQQHKGWGGETGSGVFASPGAAQTFHAAGGAKGQVRLGRKPGDVKSGALVRKGKSQIYRGANA